MTSGSARLRVAAAAALLFAVGCSQDYPQNTLAPIGRVAKTQGSLFWAVFWIAAVIFVLVEGLIVFAVFRFRSRDDRAIPAQVHGNNALEIVWTIIPAVLLVFVAVPTVATLWRLAKPPSKDALHIEVVGHQWWWEYRYPAETIVTANELVVPTGRQVALTLSSADVIHSFWMARLAGKQDVIPGRHNPLNFSVDDPGLYFGQCAEFCGLSHANMRLRVVAIDSAGFDAWVAEQKRAAVPPASGDAAAGLKLFSEKGCIGCHTIAGVPAAQGQVGPNLTHLQSRDSFAGAMFEMSTENLRMWLHDPPAAKPGSKMPNLKLSDDEIRKLVAFLETLH